MRIFNPRGQTIHIHQLFADLPGNIGQGRPSGHHTDLLREDQARLQPT